VVETDYPAICNGEYNPIPESSEPEIPYVSLITMSNC
jgi:arabinogalactan endo-1,4-beta-galactosidase